MLFELLTGKLISADRSCRLAITFEPVYLCCLGLKQPIPFKVSYLDEGVMKDADVPRILEADGVVDNDLFDVNNEVVSIDSILQGLSTTVSSSKRIIDSPSNSVTIIKQFPGEGNREHFHPAWDEWWLILDGTWEWLVEGSVRLVSKGDIVFIERGRRHKITAVGDTPAIRMAVSRSDVIHDYDV